MPKIFITNKSGHPQKFLCHGFNGNKDLVVNAHGKATIQAPDHQNSGAIIAVHDGHEGEQAEITFNGFGGNDFIDMSNIVGAGGNMTIQQQGDPRTRKGDPLFMQNLRKAWAKASPGTKNDLKGSIFTDKAGKVVRMGPIKEHPKLESFVRTFADGKTYIGVGAWNGSPGNPSDNGQSSAAHGTKNAVITYSDGDATPGDGEGHNAHRAPMEQIRMVEHFEASAAHKPEEHKGEVGIDLHNKSNKACTYFFYDNYWNGNGTAGANFDHPLKSVKLAPKASHFVPLPASFKGRVQRETIIPATWVEFQCEASNDHAAHGDISLQQGCDGAATIQGTDGAPHGSGPVGGFTKDVITHAPAAAKVKRQDGVVCLASTMGNWMAGPNEAAAQWLFKEVGQKKAYIKGGSGTDDISSKNRRFEVVFY
ncbi:MAG: hypothetical protein LQ339_002909 [Xanthoria mediterranea]|nr:MAG: hypothetical protein LQ339_002909 [Xanthoria mediterranea]